MSRQRMEAFSDGMFAIIITIMILELRAPKEPTWAALRELRTEFLAYVMSFVFIGIYWTNHHHFMHAVDRVNGAILWGNLHLLFWLSLVPFTTAWIGHDLSAKIPTAIYGISLLMPAVAWMILSRAIKKFQGPNSKLRTIVGNDFKANLSGALYAVAIPVAFVNPLISDVIFISVALMWIIPDRRVERHLR